MAPIKFEDQLKDKLENRTLNPSPDAWNTLADKLDKEEDKNNTTKFWWLGIAASILGVILVTTQFYKNSRDVKDLPVIVNTKILPDSNLDTTSQSVEVDEMISNSTPDVEIIENTQTNEVASALNTETNNAEELIKSGKVILNIETAQDAIVSIESSKQEINDKIEVKALNLEDLKIMEVVNVIKTLQTNQSTVSEREIDSLLKLAQREILTQRILDESSKTVSADALLQDVELELEQSFRAKVFEALKSTYNSAKTAVAERRN